MSLNRRTLFHRVRSYCTFLAALFVYLLRVWPWANAQLNFDEVITLFNFCEIFSPNATLAEVFRNYHWANNHILSTAIYWGWTRLVTPQASEVVLRLPSILCGLMTLCVVGLWWRRFLGERLALFGVVIMAASPIFPAFAFQIRGYSLTMLLTSIAVGATYEYLHRKRPAWLALSCLCALLQTLVMPTAAIMAAMLAIVTVLYRRPGETALGPALGRRFAAGTVIALAALLGLSYYLTLGNQFRLAMADAAQYSADWWPTWWSSARHVLTAFPLHLGLALIPIAATGLLLLWPHQSKPGLLSVRNGLMAFGAWLAVEGLLYLAAGKQVPFPRNSLTLLPLFTFAALLFLRGSYAIRVLPWTALLPTIVLTAAVGIGITYWQDAAALAKTRKGDVPLNLLHQHYRGDSDTRTIVKNIHDSGRADLAFLVVSDNDSATAKWYYTIYGHNNNLVVDRSTLLQNPTFWRPHPSVPVLVSARLEPEARQLYYIAQFKAPVCKLLTLERRQLWGPDVKPE